MKKGMTILMCVLLVLLCSATAYAAETGQYETAGDLYEAWMQSGGVPDYVSGIWSTDGGCENLTIGIVDDENKEQAVREILELVKDDSTVTIVYQTRSRNYLYGIMEDINTYFEKDLGLVSAGTDEYENRVDIKILEQRKDDPATQAMMDELRGKYGDAVSFSYAAAYAELTIELEPVEQTQGQVLMAINPESPTGSMPGFVILCLAMLMCAAAAMVFRKKYRAMQTAEGTFAAGQAPVTTGEVEERIRQSASRVPPSLDARVMDSINSCETRK